MRINDILPCNPRAWEIPAITKLFETRCIIRESSDFNALTQEANSLFLSSIFYERLSQTRCFPRVSFVSLVTLSLFLKGSLIILSRAEGRRGLTHGGACLKGKDRESFKTGWRWFRQLKKKRKKEKKIGVKRKNKRKWRDRFSFSVSRWWKNDGKVHTDWIQLSLWNLE